MSTQTTTTPSARPAARPTALVQGIRVLLGAFGAFKLYGTAYFTFFASAEEGGDPSGLVDWSVAAWSAILAVSLIVAAVRLGGAGRRIVPVVGGLLLVDIAFSLVKLLAYDEPEAVGFMAVDLVLLGLVALSARRSAG